MRKKFVELCKEELSSNKNSFVLLGDIGVGGFLMPNEELPERVINMGIAEQAMVGFASGLSSTASGNIILHTISPFLVERAFEQIKLCCGYNEIKLILISANGPYDYEKLGPTHHCNNDIDILATLPNIELRLPATISDLVIAFKEAIKSEKSFYIRMTSRSATIPIEPITESNWNIIYLINGEISNMKPGGVLKGLICIGESLSYCLNKYKNGNYIIYWSINPDSTIPKLVKEVESIIIFEPYLNSRINVGYNYNINIVRKNFKKNNKKIILKNLGWEDYDD
jgi:deoxyxylulose-5-phosphate synthase